MTAHPSAAAFRVPVRVYWEDTDAAGIVFYANYLRWFERARTEWLRAHGHSQQELARTAGMIFTVVSLRVDYRAPARLDDELLITCEPQPEGAASLRFQQRIYRAGAAVARSHALLLEANVRVACVDARTLRPRRLPDFLLEALAGEVGAHG